MGGLYGAKPDRYEEDGVLEQLQKGNSDIQFGRYISMHREKQQYSAQQLGDGVCSYREILQLENGTRRPGKLVTDAVLERLGVGAEDYECLLDYPDYQRWEDRQRILHAITWEEFGRAEELLKEYEAKHCEDNNGSKKWERLGRRLERQFHLSMQTLLAYCRGGGKRELEEGYRRALELTVPAPEDQPLSRRALSLKELNLILEVERNREDGGRPERYLEVLEYIEAKHLDDVARAKIYPKAVYFFCCCVEEQRNARKTAGQAEDREWTEERLLGYCGQAIEALREGERMYFLWELLWMRESLLGRLIERLVCRGEAARADAGRAVQEKSRLLRLALEQVYREYGIPKETFEFCYLYVIKEAYCMNDVIRVRRRMLGLKAEALYKDICTDKTLQNIENRRTTPQRPVAEELLERLGLPKDRTKTEIVTDDLEVRELVSQMRRELNDKNYAKANELLERLRQGISAEIPCNWQFLKKQEALLDWHMGKLSREEYQEKMRKALEITLPLEAFLAEGEKYLTNVELTCIQNMITNMEEGSEEILICMHRFEEMYQPIIRRGMQETVANMYEFIMGTVGSMWGNRGEYDRSDEIDDTIIRGCLRFRRIGALHGSLYGRWWNHKERVQKGIPTDKSLKQEEELGKCTLFAQFTREYNDVEFYQKKLKEET